MKVVRKWRDLPKVALYFDPMNRPMCYGIEMDFWPRLEGKEVEESWHDGAYKLQLDSSEFFLTDDHVEEVDD